ncbi:MAG: hypothetical protein Q8R37_03765 [Nanoarchaeota archaeon]|nr:hypothetical protein [Nanoarchaeota archaeon]
MTHKKEASNLYLLGVAAVVVIAVVVLVLNNGGSLEGAAQVIVPESSRVKTCVDTDPNDDWHVRGYAQQGVQRYYDVCDGNDLSQYYCKSGSGPWPRRSFECPSGCERGACLPRR